MSTFALPALRQSIDIFGHGEGAKTAIAYGVPVLGEIEIDPRIASAAIPASRSQRSANRVLARRVSTMSRAPWPTASPK